MRAATTRRSAPWPGDVGGDGAGGETGAAGLPSAWARTSASTIRPPGPVPPTCAMSMPHCLARSRASGEALSLPAPSFAAPASSLLNSLGTSDSSHLFVLVRRVSEQMRNALRFWAELAMQHPVQGVLTPEEVMPGEALPEHIPVDLFRLLIAPQVYLRARKVPLQRFRYPFFHLSTPNPTTSSARLYIRLLLYFSRSPRTRQSSRVLFR